MNTARSNPASVVTKMMLVIVAIIGCSLSSPLTNHSMFVSAYSPQQRPQQQQQQQQHRQQAAESTTGRREFFGFSGLVAGSMASLAVLPAVPHRANANDAVLSSKYCAYGEGSDCEDLAEGNPYILELQRKSAANKQANMESAKNAFYAKNYPDWFAAVGKTMVQKESDGTFVVIDNTELRKLSDQGKITFTTPTAMGGKVKDVTQKPMLVLKE